MNILTLKEAILCGMTPSSLRATANSLDRIARQGYYHIVQDEVPDPDGGFDINREFVTHHEAYNWQECRDNARGLRQLAKMMEKSSNTVVKVRVLEPS